MTAPIGELFSLARRVAVVTGASSGIGRAMAESVAEAGASTVLIGRRRSALKEVEEVITSHGGTCVSVTADLSERHQVARAAHQCREAYGPPDILVNAAGVNLRPPLQSLTVEQWDETLAVNLTAPFLLGQHLAPTMAERAYGRIINLGSQQAFRAFNNSGAYGVSKAGVVALTRSQAEVWSAHGVCCNAVIPGFVRTAMTESVFADPERAASLAARTMGGRNGTVDDFRGVAVFLASAASAHITGQVIFVDGGFSAR